MDCKKMLKPSIKKIVLTLVLFIVITKLYSFLFLEAVKIQASGDLIFGSILNIVLFLFVIFTPFGILVFDFLYGFAEGYVTLIGMFLLLLYNLLDLIWIYAIVSFIDSRLKK